MEILKKLIAQSRYLQNNPKAGVHPQEIRAVNIVKEYLAPYLKPDTLVVETLEYT